MGPDMGMARQNPPTATATRPAGPGEASAARVLHHSLATFISWLFQRDHLQ